MSYLKVINPLLYAFCGKMFRQRTYQMLQKSIGKQNSNFNRNGTVSGHNGTLSEHFSQFSIRESSEGYES